MGLLPDGMAKLIGVFWFFTLLLFLLFFFYSYAAAPEQLSISFGQPDQNVITKETYFYLGIGLFLLTNISFYLASKLMKLRSPDKPLYFYLRQWLRSFAGLSNLFLIILLVLLGLSNSEENFDLTHYDFLIYFGPIPLVAWLGLLVFLLFRQGSRQPVV